MQVDHCMFSYFPHTVLGFGFVLATLATVNHIVTLWWWTIFRLIETIEVHSGYDIPYLNPLHLLPFYAGKDVD